MDLWDGLRLQFPVTNELTYLNHAAVSPLPLRCKDRMQEYLEELVHHGAERYPQWVFRALDRARELGAQLLGTVPSQVFFVRSTTQGLGIAATGIPVKEGDNVVLVKREFPANIRPWLPLQRKGVELRFVAQREGRVEIDDLARAVDRRTAAVSISFVQFLSGFRVDLARVAELCRHRGSDALLVVDAIQGAGAFPLNVEAMGIDFLSADSHKWLLGPEGVGLGYASPRAIERIVPALEGWLSVPDPFDFFNIDQPLKSTATRYEEGAYNVAGICGLAGSLELILSLGVKVLEQRVLQLTDFLAERLRRRGWTVHSPRERDEEKSGIVLTSREGADLEQIKQRLDEARIVISMRGGALRIAPHGYNRTSELEALLRVLG